MLKFKVGDRVRTAATFIPRQYANMEATVTKVDEDDETLPYRLNLGDRIMQWAAESGVTHLRTPEAIRADIAALEAELAGATTLKVGDRVTLTATVIEVTKAAVCIKVDAHIGEVWYHASALTKVQ